MDRNQALRQMWVRMRDFAGWAGADCQGTPPIPIPGPSPSNETIEANLQAVAAFVQANLPIIGRYDPEAWRKRGQKRQELDEAFSVLNLPPLQWEEGDENRGSV